MLACLEQRPSIKDEVSFIVQRMISIKIHRTYREVVAVCDSSLLGKYLEEGKRCLEVRPSFFKDKEITFEEAVKTLKWYAKEDATFNIVGPESVKAAIEAGLVEKGDEVTIQNIPFILILA